MPFSDKTLICCDCGEAFVFTAGEQEFHQSKGFTNEPRRCPTCRAARKGATAVTKREQFTVACAACGKPATVPFQPRGDRPVYCSECFQPQPRAINHAAAPRSLYFAAPRPHSRRGEEDFSRRTPSNQPFFGARSPRGRRVRVQRDN